MDYSILDANLFKKMLESGFRNLAAHFQEINDLNVFPVPDGDTGTNMKLTFSSGLNYIKEEKEVGKMSQELARGMLFGARGNSGVLTSRYFFGLSNGLEGKEVTGVFDFALAMVEAYKVAYSAVAEPAEGTILTVAREGIESVRDSLDYSSITFTKFLTKVVNAMKKSLDNTPNLLPVLKEAGVIDSGGKGLVTIFEGFLKFFTGEDEDDLELNFHEHSSTPVHIDSSLFNETSTLDYGYCTEFLLQLLVSKIDIDSFDLESFKNYLNSHGESVVCFQNGTIVKVHVHTKKPYEVIEYAQQFGEFLTFKMENMALQHNEVIAKKEEKKKIKKKYAVVAIAQGQGIIDIFKELGADVVIDGGKTMNTSSAELITAFKEANADYIIVLPNETNIFLAAKQAASLYKDSKVKVLETKSIPAGYACLSMILGDDETGEECYSAMKDANEWVTTGFICKSNRDTVVDGVKCIKGDYIQAVNHKMVGCNNNIVDSFYTLLDNVEDIEDKESMYFFYGKEVSESLAQNIINLIRDKYPNLEVGAYEGKQEVYDFLIGIN
ncbi:MAG: DAK2 domain-containing protein [Bacilli bacterium]|nr:DAK2 domain-containing protein [Bacilli bacterium]